MEISELRIGNLVKIKTSNDAAFYPVYAIDGMGLKVVLGGCRQYEGWKYEKLLKPIPITEDMLTKCGFVANHNFQIKEQTLFTNEDFWIIHNAKSGRFALMIGERITCEIKFLHHLQNLFLDLTGKKLYITL